LLTVGGSYQGFSIAESFAAAARGLAVPDTVVQQISALNVVLNPENICFPLTAGTELFAGVPGDPPNPSQRFQFEIVFYEKDVAEGVSLLGTLNDFAKVVESTISALAPLLKS
jgi:hypothetical protein